MTESKKTIIMHRLIMKAEPGIMIDHRNGNGLDNRKENLRICTRSQNSQNIHYGWGVSRFKGVSRHNDGVRWRSNIGLNGRSTLLGIYNTEEEAAIAYDRASILHFGEFACLNLPGMDDGRDLNRATRPKLTAEEATEIFYRAHQGESKAKLAAEFEIGVKTIRKIARGAAWSELGLVKPGDN